MNNERIYEQEREVDLLDLLGRILAKWRNVLLVGGVGLLIGIAVACMLGYVDMKKSDTEMQRNISSKNVDKALEKLLETENGEILKETAERNIISYKNIESLYEVQDGYLSKSIYNNMDANHITKVELSYYIDNHYINEYPIVNGCNNIGDIINAYITKLRSDKVCDDIAAVIGVETEPKYIREIVSVYNSSTSNLAISITTDDSVTSEKIAEYYKGIMDSTTKEVIADYGDLTVTLLEEQEYTESDINVLNAQNEAKAKFTGYDEQLQKIEKSMSGVQLEYYRALVKDHKLNAMEVSEKHGFFFYVSKKMIVLVTVVAIFLAFCVYGVGYVISGTVKTGEELALMSRSILLGTVLVDKDKKRKHILFDKWAVALTDGRVLCDDAGKTTQAISETLIQYLSSNNLESVMFAGSDIKHNNVVDRIRECIQKAGFTGNIAMDAFDSSETISNITASDIVVFVGEVGCSKYKRLERILSLCQLYKKSIVGTVALQERI